MKKHSRILCLVLAAVFVLSAGLQVSAAACIQGITKDLEHNNIYPAGDVVDATIVKGSYKDLGFLSGYVPPYGPQYYYFVQIYRGSLAQLDALAEQGRDAELVEEFYFHADSSWNKPMYARLNADERYPAGDYSVVCFLADVETDQILDPYELFWTEVHVVNSPRPATDFSMKILMEDGQHEIHDNDVVFARYHSVFLTLTPGPIPSTGTQTYSISSTLPEVVTAKMNKNYHEFEIKWGEYVTRVNIVSGNIRHSFWINTGYYDEQTCLQLYHGGTTLCIGQEDTCVVKGKVDNSHHYDDYMCAPDWSSSDPSVATVTSWGLVKALKPGTVTITATAGRFQQSVTYTVGQHQLPADTPVTGPTATQPKQAVGHCSLCGRDDAVNIYEPAVFTDTTPTAWYAEHVDRVYDLGLMNGTGGHTFSPDSTLTRAMAATVLYRIAGKPEAEGESPFPDVPDGQWYTDAVIWAQSNGIVTGYQDGTFGPNRSITREQFAAILYRYMCSVDPALEVPDTLGSFPDAGKVQSWAREAMCWAVGEKLINGVAVGSQSFLRPENYATRAQFATIISRFMTVLEKYTPEEPAPNPPEER